MADVSEVIAQLFPPGAKPMFQSFHSAAIHVDSWHVKLSKLFFLQKFSVAMRQAALRQLGRLWGLCDAGLWWRILWNGQRLGVESPIATRSLCLFGSDGVVKPGFIMIRFLIVFCFFCFSFYGDSEVLQIGKVSLNHADWDLEVGRFINWFNFRGWLIWEMGFNPNLQPPLWTMASSLAVSHQGYMHPLAVIQRHLARGTCYNSCCCCW